MSEYVFKLPDLGEGTVEAEIIEWHVKPGDVIEEGQIVVDVMTDKANVELPAPASGRVLRASGQPGDMAIVGAELLALETDTGAPILQPAAPPPRIESPMAVEPSEGSITTEPLTPTVRKPSSDSGNERTPNRFGGRALASPSLRRQASELGIDLASITGSGPRGRIVRKDLEAVSLSGLPIADPPRASNPTDEVTEVRIIGVRRVIAKRMQAAKQDIPHFTYVEEIDVTALERLRINLNESPDQGRLTLLPFIGLALIRALRKFPQCNALHDAEIGVLQRHSSVHLGIATQTQDGLKVPVVHDANGLDIRALADAINIAASKARDGTATRADLTGSTITLTSLGKLGGIVSTPVINAPEMGIIGVNKAVDRPMVVNGRVEVRRMMNLSSSFDHRFIDGFDAASMIQEMKSLLEEPAMLFL